MSARRTSARKRSSTSVAKSAQLAEILNIGPLDEHDAKAEAKQRRAEKKDYNYAPDKNATPEAVEEERDEKSPDLRPRKRQNSDENAPSDSASIAAPGSEAKSANAQAADANAREVGPLSDRSRFLPPGTHTAVQSHAQWLFDLAVAAEKSAQSAASGSSAGVRMEIDIEAETDDDEKSPSSNRSSRSTNSSRSVSSASSSSSGTSASSGSNGSSGSSDEYLVGAAADRPAAEDSGSRPRAAHSADKDEKQGADNGAQLSLGLIAEDDEGRPLSPLLVEFGPRGLSATRTPEVPRLPSPVPPGALSLSASEHGHKDDGKHAGMPSFLVSFLMVALQMMLQFARVALLNRQTQVRSLFCPRRRNQARSTFVGRVQRWTWIAR